jgi:hypothetical protein
VVPLLVLLCSCGAGSSSSAGAAADQAFLDTLHQQDPTINQLRSDTQLLRLGSAACAAFAAHVSFFSLADTMAVNDGNLPPTVLGTVIKTAGENLCPKYRSRVAGSGTGSS